MINHQDLIPHLFRTEFAKITSVLCKLFGIAQIEIAEDIASETFMAALESWPYKGIPANPTAWLYAVSKNKARNYLLRHQLFHQKIAGQWQGSIPIVTDPDIDWTEQNILDSQLQMLFALCHPDIAPESQVALALRILCGFGIDEIANAFLTSKATINKRLMRAREKLRTEQKSVEFPGSHEINNRLASVMTTLYLLFNEGYYSESEDEVLRTDLCHEAMRLTLQLIEHPQSNLPPVHALYALMCFHASRFKARKTSNGEMILYEDQDDRLWDHTLIAKGIFHLNLSANGDTLYKYHLEASIAYWHTIKSEDAPKWQSILSLYDQLLHLDYTAIAALNRVYAYYKIHGATAALPELKKLDLTSNHYYYVLLAELYYYIDPAWTRHYLNEGLPLAKSGSDKKLIEKKLASLDKLGID